MRPTILGWGAAVLLATGCQTTNPVRYVSKNPDGSGGIVAITRDTPENEEKALAMMKKHVGDFVIDKREEVALDARTGPNTRSNIPGSGPGNTDAYAAAPVGAKEWRLYYHKKPAGTNPDQAPPSAVRPAGFNGTSFMRGPDARNPGGVAPAGGTAPTGQAPTSSMPGG